MLITLTTDFGPQSPYVAVMKGVILSLHGDARIVDITHGIAPQDVRSGAIVLEDVAPRFPADTLHVAVVDPGVGTDRGLIYTRLGRQQFLAPDNGLLSRLALRTPPREIIRLTNPEFWLQPVSATFHGRDILAPVAARLSAGLDPRRLGPPQEKLVRLDWPQPVVHPHGIDGHVLAIDAFGNVVTNVTADMLPDGGQRVRVACEGQEATAHVRTYGDAAAGTLVSLVGSTDRLELAVVGGSAAARLATQVDRAVTIRWAQ